jgi:hypothetical protein
MRVSLAGMIKRTTIFLLLMSILVLMLNSFLPLVTLENVDDVNDPLFLNFESMKSSNNTEIQKLYGDVDFINLCLWILIIVNLLSLFGVIIKLSQKYSLVGDILLTLGCTSIVFSVLSCYSYFMFILKVNNLTDISPAYIVPSFYFMYIMLVLSSLILLASFNYLLGALPYLTKSLKNMKTKKTKEEEKKPTNLSEKRLRRKQDLESEFQTKRKIAQEWDIEEEEETKPIRSIKVNQVENEPEIIKEKTNGKIKETQDKPSPFPEKDNIQIDNVEGSSEKKKYSVKCPECNFIFISEKDEDEVTKIKCPRCGKEGIIK